MPFDYYSAKLSGERLRRCYELAPPRVKRYLAAEVDHLVSRIPSGVAVLELGCGYGRVLGRLAAIASLAWGVDTSLDSLRLARRRLAMATNVVLAGMDASRPALRAAVFDVVCCVQNGISSFHVDQRALIETALDIVRPGGRALFSSYAEAFWEDRLEWFRIQAAHGLVGQIDESATRDGTIVCRDGFTATTATPRQFSELTRDLGGTVSIDIVDDSSVFCEILKKSGPHEKVE